jgi:mannose-6-phosphate isomerase
MEALELSPQFVSALWGGRRLAHLTDAPKGGLIAEVWLASDLDQRSTRIANGIHHGKLIREVVGPFPLLAKLIDAEQPLSVQVHPDDVKAREMGVHVNGKTEAWVVLHAEPGSQMWAGLRSGVSCEDLVGGLRRGEIEQLLYSFEPHVGDMVYLPAGTVHALGGGITIFELQQSCDITYRLFDWNRIDPKTGLGRELHVEQALSCIDFSRGPVEPIRTEPKSISCDYFELSVYRKPVTIGGDGRMRLLATYGGRATGCVDIEPGRAVLIPSMMGECHLSPEPNSWLFECVVP